MDGMRYRFSGDDFVTGLENLRDATPAVENQAESYRDAWDEFLAEEKTEDLLELDIELAVQALETVLVPHSQLDLMIYMEDIRVPVKARVDGEPCELPMSINADSLDSLIPGLVEVQEKYPVTKTQDIDYNSVGMPVAIIDLAPDIIKYWERLDSAYDEFARIETELQGFDIESPVQRLRRDAQYADQAEYILSKTE